MISFFTNAIESFSTFIIIVLLVLLLTREGRRAVTRSLFRWLGRLLKKLGRYTYRLYQWGCHEIIKSKYYQLLMTQLRADGLSATTEKHWKKIENPALAVILMIGLGWIRLPFLDRLANGTVTFFSMKELDLSSMVGLGMIALILLGGLPFLIDYWKRGNGKRYGTSELGVWHKMLNASDGLLINGSTAHISARASFNHAMLIAPSGAGKTTSYILPNIISLASIGHSILLSDIKGELFDLSSGFLKTKGYDVQVIDLADISQSMRFNPLKRLKTEQDIKGFAEMIFNLSNDGANTEGIWKQGAVSLIECIVKCLKNTEGERYANIANLNFILTSINLSDGCEALESFIAYTAPDNETLMKFEQFRQQEIKLASGQLSSAISCLSIFQTKEMRYLTADDDFDFNSLRKHKVALFFKLPVGRSSIYAPFLTIFYSQFFDYLMSTKLERDDQSIFCLLDEFGNLKKIPAFSEIITTIRSKRVSLSLVVQDVQQLDVYGRDKAEVIKGNCASVIALSGIKGKQTLEMLQNQTGVSTYKEYDITTGKMIESRRELFTKDELRRLPENKMLYLYKNIQPLELALVPIYRNHSLMNAGGLKSIDGELTSKYRPLKRPKVADLEVEYYPVEGDVLQ